ncbi:ABC transporter permease [Paenibacillus sp. NPDC058177]|uniref:ABC transporter permease n=2 Tax=unclassified Paenibacillus TaxID=185978 RepID=UPI0036DE6ECF
MVVAGKQNTSRLNAKGAGVTMMDIKLNANRESGITFDPSSVPSKKFSKTRRALSSSAPPTVAFIGFFLVWEALVRLIGLNALTLPAPSSVLAELFGHLSFYLPHAWTTLYEAIGGFLLGSVLALTGGIIMAHSRLIERSLLPLAVLANVTPISAIAPLLMIWFGFGALPKVLIAAIVTFFPMLVNSITGFRSVDANNYEYMKSLHASKMEIFLKLRLPNSLPYLFSAARTCVSLSVMGAVVGEWSGSTEGLGNLVMLSSNNMQMNQVFASILLLALMGIILTNLVRLVERRVLSWHSSEQSKG